MVGGSRAIGKWRINGRRCGEAIEEGRVTLHSLRSPESASASLEESLADLAGKYAPTSAQRIRILVIGRTKALRPAVKEQIHLIGREALFNALRHSNATSIDVEVEYTSELQASVRTCKYGAGESQEPQWKYLFRTISRWMLRLGRDQKRKALT